MSGVAAPWARIVRERNHPRILGVAGEHVSSRSSGLGRGSCVLGHVETCVRRDKPACCRG